VGRVNKHPFLQHSRKFAEKKIRRGDYADPLDVAPATEEKNYASTSKILSATYIGIRYLSSTLLRVNVSEDAYITTQSMPDLSERHL
jgi:hypothetical protein